MEKQLKIAYLIRNIKDEANRVQYQRTKYLSERHCLYLFLERDARIPQGIEKKSIVARSRFGSKKILYPLHFGWCIRKIVKLGKKEKIDLVYSFYGPFSMIQGFILKLLGYKWVADIWDHPSLPSKTNGMSYLPLHKAGTYITKKSLKRADLVISAILPEALHEYNIAPQKLLPVTNGVNLEITKPKGTIEKDNTFRVFYVGYVQEDRGIGTLLFSIARLKDKIGNLRLILAGNARQQDRDYLDKVIRELGLGDCVDFRGILSHEEVLHLEESSDVCVFPFPREKELHYIYPIKIFEYLAMSKAVVATNLKGVSIIIKDGENGLLFEPNDPKDMVRAILKIYNNPELRKKIESNARKSVAEYDWNNINERINNKLKEVAGI